MGRPWRDGSRRRSVAAGLVLLGSALGCGAREAAPGVPPNPPAPQSGGFGTASDRAKLQACYAGARLRDPNLSVHTVALFFARDGKLVFVDVELPDAPQLARCLSDAILSSSAFEPPDGQGAGSLASGALRIDLGPAPATAAASPTPAEIRARQLRATRAALRQGALRESDPIVREMLNPPPPWPTGEMQAELDACHRDALSAHPGLALHREVIYLARAAKMLLADLSIPEAPELQRCVLDRVLKWSSPFAGPTEEATLSSFFIDLGRAEAPPMAPETLTAALARRRSLVEHARELGLIDARDPLLKRFKDSAPPPRSDAGADKTLGVD